MKGKDGVLEEFIVIVSVCSHSSKPVARPLGWLQVESRHRL